MTIVPDDKDWTWVCERACPECGFDPAGIADAHLPDRILASARGWESVLAAPAAAAAPDERTWSALEYAAHVRDVHVVMAARLRAVLTASATTPARFAPWDQDAAAVAGRYREQDPGAVASGLVRAAGIFATLYRGVGGDAWNRRGLRSDGGAFTARSLAAYSLHDFEHHRVDVGLPARAPAPTGWEHWASGAGLRAIAAAHREAIDGWNDPAGFGVGYRDRGSGAWVFPMVNGPAAGRSLTAALLAQALGYRAGTVIEELDRPTLTGAIASLARAEAAADVPAHPNLGAWREVLAVPDTARVAVLIGSLDDPASHPAHAALLADPRLRG